MGPGVAWGDAAAEGSRTRTAQAAPSEGRPSERFRVPGWPAGPIVRFALGPLLTVAAAAVLAVLESLGLGPPNPGAALYLLIVFSSFLGGTRAGLASAAITVVYVLLSFSYPGRPFVFTDENLRRIAVNLVTAPAVAVLTGVLRERAERILVGDKEILAELVHERTKRLDAATARLEQELDQHRRWDTERRRILEVEQAARQAAEATRAQVASLLERITDGFVALDRDWRYVYVNKRAADMFGRKPADLIGKHIWTEFPEGVGQPFHRAYEKAFAEQKPAVLEDYYEPWDRWFENRIYPSPDGIAIFFQEVTDRKRAERALQLTVRRLDTVVGGAPIVVYELDREGTILAAQGKALERLGQTPEMLIGASAFDFYARMPEIQQEIRRALSGESRRTVMQVGSAYMDASLLPVRDATGQVTGVVGVATDVTNLLTAERDRDRLLEEARQHASELEVRVEERTKELRQINEELEAFGYSASHDLRAPLRAMQGFSQALLEDYGPKLDDQGRDYAARIVRASQRLDGMIEDLLSLSRIGRTALRIASLDPSSTVREVLTNLDAMIAEAHADIEVEQTMPEVLADRGVLAYVVQNLLTNALKFVKKGERPRVRVRSETRGDAIRIWFEDDGIGIAPEHLERIWHVFERLHGSETYAGTGIGLAIVHRGVEHMGGRAGVESDLGKGSRFWIELPKAPGGT